jgi:hypothetical protein
MMHIVQNFQAFQAYKINHLGVAQLVERGVWDAEVGCSSHLTQIRSKFRHIPRAPPTGERTA